MSAANQFNFAPIRSANARTEIISTPAKSFNSSRSPSPVTRNLHLYATAAARIGVSSGSRSGEAIAAASGLNRHSDARRPISSSASLPVRRNFAISLSRTSRQINGVTTGVQRDADEFSTLRQKPSCASAASQTLESRRTSTGEAENFLFRNFRAVLHQLVAARPQVLEPVFLEPAEYFVALGGRKSFQFVDQVYRCHVNKIAESLEERNRRVI